MFGVGASASKTTTNPWGPQAGYLKQGFEQASNLLNQPLDPRFGQVTDAGFGWGMNQLPGAQMMQQYGQQLMPALGQANNFYGNVMQNGFQNPFAMGGQYDQIADNYWTPAHQRASDAIRAQTVEGLRRSDFGDALGASLAGVGVGEESSPYLRMRGQAMGDAALGMQNQLANLHMGAMGQAQNRAGQFGQAALGQQGMQMQAAQNQFGAGMAGANLMAQGFGLGQQGLQGAGDSLNFQQNAQWSPLLNYWNVIGSNSWGSETRSKSASANVGFG